MYLLWESTVRCWINWQKLFGLCIKGERMSKSRLFATVLIIHATETGDKETKVQKSLKAAVNPAIIWSSRDFFAGEKCNKPCEYIKKLFFLLQMHCIQFVSISFLHLQQGTQICIESELVIPVKYQLDIKHQYFSFHILALTIVLLMSWSPLTDLKKIWIFKGMMLETNVAFLCKCYPPPPPHSVLVCSYSKVSRE